MTLRKPSSSHHVWLRRSYIWLSTGMDPHLAQTRSGATVSARHRRWQAPRVRYSDVPPHIRGAPPRGHEGVREWVRDLYETLSEFHADYQEILDLGDRTFGIGVVRGRGTASAAEIESPHGTVVEFKDSKGIRIRTYLDPKEALEAAGLGVALSPGGDTLRVSSGSRRAVATVWGTALHPQLKVRQLEGPPFGNGSQHLGVVPGQLWRDWSVAEGVAPASSEPLSDSWEWSTLG